MEKTSSAEKIGARGTGWLAGSSLAQVINAAAGFATNIIYARTLPLHDVGLIALINSMAMLLYVVLDRGVGTWLTRNVASGRLTLNSSVSMVLRAAVPGIIALLLGLGLLLALASYLGPDLITIATLTLPMTLAFWLFQASLAFAQGANMPHSRSLAISANGLATLAITAIVLLVFKTGVVGAALFSALIYASVACWLTRNTLKRVPTGFRHKVPYAVAIKEAQPLFGSNVVTQLLGVGDVLIAGLFMSSSVVGQYQIAKKTAQAAVLPLMSALPMVLGQLSNLSAPRRIELTVKLAVISTLLFSAVVVFLYFFADWALTLAFGDNYGALRVLVIGLMMAYGLQFFRDLLGVLATSYGNFHRHFQISLAGLGLLIVLIVTVVMSVRSAESLALMLGVTLLLGVCIHLILLYRDGIAGNRLFAVLLGSVSTHLCLCVVLYSASAGWL